MTAPESPEGRDEREQQKWHERTRYQVLLFAVGIVLFVLIVGFILDWYIDPQKATQRKDLAQALGLITAGVAGAVGIFFTWRGQRLAREAQEDTQKNTQEQLEQARRGQITERFTQSIDQLGAIEEGKKNLEVRLGGIYSLERTAREDRDYHWPIMEVLTAYVREHASLDGGVNPPEPDVQAILTVIGRRSIYHRDVEYGHIDLRGIILAEANLQGAILDGANLQRAILPAADLQLANLQGADLDQASLQGAILDGANLQGVELDRANLQGTHFQGADLQRANLQLANLQQANLQGANLDRANFEGADLQGADLRRVNLANSQGLSQEQLEQAYGDESTRIPTHLKTPTSWH